MSTFSKHVLLCTSFLSPHRKNGFGVLCQFVKHRSQWGKLSLGKTEFANSSQSWDKLKIGIVGAPFSLGQPHPGLDNSPSLLRQSGLLERIKLLGHDLVDYGDVSYKELTQKEDGDEQSRRTKNVVEFNKQLSQTVETIVKDERLCITLGGDHSIGLGTLHGFAAASRNSCVLWVDAHADINTMRSSGSGNMHGMPVSFNLKQLFKESVGSLDNMEWFTPRLDPERIAFIGLRSVDPTERRDIDDLNIPCFSMYEVDQLGIKEVTRRALDMINPNRDRDIHVSLDIDVLDPIEAPATGTRVPGGLTLREALTILEDVHSTGLLRALDLVEVNSTLSDSTGAEKTVEAAKRLILASVGGHRGGRPPLD